MVMLLSQEAWFSEEVNSRPANTVPLVGDEKRAGDSKKKVKRHATDIIGTSAFVQSTVGYNWIGF
jgi:hypothetical protein